MMPCRVTGSLKKQHIRKEFIEAAEILLKDLNARFEGTGIKSSVQNIQIGFKAVESDS